MVEELGDFDKYYIIQIWSDKDVSAIGLGDLAIRVSEELKSKNNVKIIEIDGPTPFLPDFFSERYGRYRGYLISVERTANPYDLKRTCLKLEKNSSGKRICDIDVYTSMHDSIHRKDLQK